MLNLKIERRILNSEAGAATLPPQVKRSAQSWWPRSDGPPSVSAERSRPSHMGLTGGENILNPQPKTAHQAISVARRLGQSLHLLEPLRPVAWLRSYQVACSGSGGRGHPPQPPSLATHDLHQEPGPTAGRGCNQRVSGRGRESSQAEGSDFGPVLHGGRTLIEAGSTIGGPSSSRTITVSFSSSRLDGSATV